MKLGISVPILLLHVVVSTVEKLVPLYFTTTKSTPTEKYFIKSKESCFINCL